MPPDELLDLLPDGVCVVDAEGRFLYVSGSFERILGYTRGEMLGLRTFDLVHADDRAATTDEAARVTGGAFQRHFRNRYLHKAGHYVDIQWSVTGAPLTGLDAGQLDASVGIACFPENGSTAETLLAHADRAMYASKRQRMS